MLNIWLSIHFYYNIGGFLMFIKQSYSLNKKNLLPGVKQTYLKTT